MKYLETRFYDSGKAYARLFNTEGESTKELDSDKYDKYVDSIGEDGLGISVQAYQEGAYIHVR